MNSARTEGAWRTDECPRMSQEEIKKRSRCSKEHPSEDRTWKRSVTVDM